MADVGRWYGMGFEIAVVDERGNFPDAVLVELDDEAIEPSLMDYGGVFAGSGNPGRVLRGRWFEQTRDDRIDPTPMYTGDARDNPFLRTPAEAYFEKIKAQHGWTDASPTFRRQYLGEWVEDADIERIVAIWCECRERYQDAGPWLFGQWCIADAMYAPVASRFRTYGVPLPEVAQEYVTTVFADPALQEWLLAARSEGELARSEVGR